MGKKSKTNQPHSDPISTWQQADNLLLEIGNAILAINAARAKAADAINEHKAELQDTLNPLLEEITQKTESLNAFCENHKEDFAGAKSRKIRFGTLGWRFSSKITAGEKCIAKIKAHFGKLAATYLHIKEEPNKEALEKLDDATLKAVGAKRKKGDTFFADPELPPAVDYIE
jgi:phage host-nuclease inhibitor protein Gam